MEKVDLATDGATNDLREANLKALRAIKRKDMVYSVESVSSLQGKRITDEMPQVLKFSQQSRKESIQKSTPDEVTPSGQADL